MCYLVSVKWRKCMYGRGCFVLLVLYTCTCTCTLHGHDMQGSIKIWYTTVCNNMTKSTRKDMYTYWDDRVYILKPILPTRIWDSDIALTAGKSLTMLNCTMPVPGYQPGRCRFICVYSVYSRCWRLERLKRMCMVCTTYAQLCEVFEGRELESSDANGSGSNRL